MSSIIIGHSEVITKSAVKNLGSWFDSKLCMSTHISKPCRTAFYDLHNISRIRKFLSSEEMKMLVYTFIAWSYHSIAWFLSSNISYLWAMVKEKTNNIRTLYCHWCEVRENIHHHLNTTRKEGPFWTTLNVQQTVNQQISIFSFT